MNDELKNRQQRIMDLEARVARLEAAIANFNSEFSDAIGRNQSIQSLTESMRRLAESYIETHAQSLQHIEAEAFEKAKVSSQMKAGCMGEVSFVIQNGNCCPQCWHEPDEDCDICHGQSEEGGFSDLLVQVPWDAMKDIWKMMNKSYARELRQQSTSGGDGGE